MHVNSRIGALIAYAAVVAGCMLIYFVYNPEIRAQFLAPDHLGAWQSWMHRPLGAAAVSLALAVSIFFSLPASPLFYIFFGFLYGPALGTLLAALATTVGSLAAFCFFRRTIPQTASEGASVRNLFLVLLLLRSSPWVPNPLITLFCSVFNIGVATFVLTTFAGTIPLIAIYTLAAGGVHDRPDASILYSADMAVSLALLGILSLFAFLKPVRMAIQTLKGIQTRAKESNIENNRAFSPIQADIVLDKMPDNTKHATMTALDSSSLPVL